MSPQKLHCDSLPRREPLQTSIASSPVSSSLRLPIRSAGPAARSNMSQSTISSARGQLNNAIIDPAREPARSNTRFDTVTVRPSSRKVATSSPVTDVSLRVSAAQKGLNSGHSGVDGSSDSNIPAPAFRRESCSADGSAIAAYNNISGLDLISATKSSIPQRQSSLPPTSAPQPGLSHPSALGLSFSNSSTNMAQERASHFLDSHRTQVYNSENLPPPSHGLPLSLTPPTPLYAVSTTPSTFCSDSPGPFSHSSTPTSMSSHSPGFSFSARLPHRNKDDSTFMSRSSPLLAAQRTEDLSHQSYNSSSSNSTIKAGERDTNSQRRVSVQLQDGFKSSNRSPKVSPAKLYSATGVDTIRHDGDAPARKRGVPEKRVTNIAQAPPELAHLATATPRVLHSRVPSRPSREGTTTLDIREQSPIIQSNLSHLPISHHRRSSSTGSRASGLSLTTSPRSLKLSRPGHKVSNNNSDLSLSDMRTPALTRPSTHDGHTTRPASRKGGAKLKKEPTASSSQSASSDKQPSRFGFLKRSRKGPAAGTGHEGYGKYSLRRRSGTNGGVSSQGRSPSVDSFASSTFGQTSSRKSSISSQHEDLSTDDFLRERLSPVIIRGEGSTARISDSSASQDEWKGNGALGGWSTMASSVTSLESTASVAHDTSKLTLLPSAMAKEQTVAHEKLLINDSTVFDANVENDIPVSPKTIQPTASNTSKANGKTQWPMLEGTISQKSCSLTDISQEHSQEKQTRIEPLHKWNFFQRAQTRTAAGTSALPSDGFDSPELPVSVATVQPARTVPHYAMLEMPQGLDMDDLEQLMKEAEVIHEGPSSSLVLESVSKEVNDKSTGLDAAPNTVKLRETKKEDVQSVLLPSPPSLTTLFSPQNEQKNVKHGSKLTTDPMNKNVHKIYDVSSATNSTSVTAVIEQPTTTAGHQVCAAPNLELTSPGKPSRLVHIGRIPKVVSKRDRERKISSQSFSRPFAPSQPRPRLQSPNPNPVHIKRWSKESAQGLVQDQVTKDMPGEHEDATNNVVIPSEEFQLTDPSTQDTEFISFPPRKDSDISYTSSSGGYSIFGPSDMLIQCNNTNGVPEDEVWKEYDDLLDEVTSSKVAGPPLIALSSSPSLLPPTPRKSVRRSRRGRKGKKPAATTSSKSQVKAKDNNVAAYTTTVTAAAAYDSEVGSLSCAGSCHGSDLLPLKKTKLLPGSPGLMPPTGTSPGTPMSVTDLLATYEERNLSDGETEFEEEEDDNDVKANKRRAGSGLAYSNKGLCKKRTSSSIHSNSHSHLTGSGTAGATTLSEQGTSSTSVTLSSGSATAVASGTGSSVTAETIAADQNMTKYPDPKYMEEIENRNDGLVSMANLRFGALMTSKWLSFGQVLFSPVQSEFAESTGERVLVLDGLGTG